MPRPEATPTEVSSGDCKGVTVRRGVRFQGSTGIRAAQERRIPCRRRQVTTTCNLPACLPATHGTLPAHATGCTCNQPVGNKHNDYRPAESLWRCAAFLAPFPTLLIFFAYLHETASLKFRQEAQPMLRKASKYTTSAKKTHRYLSCWY